MSYRGSVHGKARRWARRDASAAGADEENEGPVHGSTQTSPTLHKYPPKKAYWTCRSGRLSFDVQIEAGFGRSVPSLSPGPGRKQTGDKTMRVMVIVKADKNSEAGVLPSKELLSKMGKYNEELVKAGIMLAGEGLHASSKGVRVKFSEGKRTVIDGPFTETKELIAGFWLWQVRSMVRRRIKSRAVPVPVTTTKSFSRTL